MPPSSLGQPGHRCTSRLQCNCAEAVVSAAGEDPAAPAEPSPWGGSRTDRLPFAGGALLERSGPGGLASPLGLGVLQTQAARCAGRGAGSFVSTPLSASHPGLSPPSARRLPLVTGTVGPRRAGAAGLGGEPAPGAFRGNWLGFLPSLSSAVKFSSVQFSRSVSDSLRVPV